VTRFILHIGPHKTGTTYIQETLFALRERLESRGVHIPAVWSAAPGLPSHMRLVWGLRRGGIEEIEEDLRKIMASRYDRVVVSCEALSRLDQPLIERLRTLLGASPVRIVYYVRRWPERLPSLWQETVKFGYDATLQEYLLEQLAAPAGAELHDAAMLDRFAAVFGLTEIELVSYSHLVDENVDIARHFLESVLGISDIEPPVSGRPNASLPVEETETIRALNALHHRRGGKRSSALREWYLAHKAALPTVSVIAAIRAHAASLRLEEAAPQFAHIYRELVDRYGSRVLSPAGSTGLHAPRAIDVQFVRPDYLLDPDVARRLIDTHEVYWSVIQRQVRGGTVI
jgi:hypothetical protein